MNIAHDIGNHLSKSRPVTGQCDMRKILFVERKPCPLLFAAMTQLQHPLGDTAFRIQGVQIIACIIELLRDRHLLGDIDAAPLIKTGQREQILHEDRHSRT